MEWIHSSSSCSNRPDLFPPIVSLCLDFSSLMLGMELRFVSSGYSKVGLVLSRCILTACFCDFQGLEAGSFFTSCPHDPFTAHKCLQDVIREFLLLTQRKIVICSASYTQHLSFPEFSSHLRVILTLQQLMPNPVRTS